METAQTATIVHHENGTHEIRNVTLILSALTLIELGLGFGLMRIEVMGLRLMVKGVIVILMLAKAFYIVGYFMHLKHEIRNMVMTIVVPLMLFVWFITAFLYDGNSFRHLKNTYDPYKKEKSILKVEKKANLNDSKPEVKKAVE
jgi:cytochrome c oxidase subunit 4